MNKFLRSFLTGALGLSLVSITYALFPDNFKPSFLLPEKPTQEKPKLTFEAKKEPIVLTEFFSYGCSFCDKLHDPLHKALQARPDVQLDLKHFIIYEQYLPIHEAQVCAAEQGQGYKFHDAYFTNHYPSRNVSVINDIAQTLNLDRKTLQDCLGSQRPTAKIQADMQLGRQLGVRGTPSLLIQGPDTPLSYFNGRTQSEILESLPPAD